MRKLGYVIASFMLLISPWALASELSQQRTIYQQALTAQKQQDWPKARRLSQQLGDYPLNIFLQYNDLKAHRSSADPKQIRRFVEQNQDSYLANSLLRYYLFTLAKQQKWRTFLSFTEQAPSSLALQCYYYDFQLKAGNKSLAWQGAEQLWLSGSSRPDACDGLFAAWDKAGLLTQDLVWQRMLLAYEKKQLSLVKYLNKRLNSEYKPYGNKLIASYGKPDAILTTKQYPLGQPQNGDIVVAALLRLIPKSPKQAFSAYRAYVKQGKLTPEQLTRVEKKLIQYVMFRHLSNELAWADKRLANIDDDNLKEQRIRYAMAKQDWYNTEKWIKLLSPERKDSERWLYWQARIAGLNGDKALARELLMKVAQERSYYGFMSSQTLATPYQLNIEKVTLDKAKLTPVAQVLARVNELKYHDADNFARTEWARLIGRHPKPMVDQLGQYALEQGWLHFAILASIETKSWDLVEQRFPMVEATTFQYFAKERQLDASLLFALARQESAFHQQARSPVGARGLMQLMPATAKYTAKKIGYQYQGVESLYEADVNVRLGSAYIAQLLEDYQGNRILASAAYNAGPHRVKQWQARSPGLEVDTWVEVIPFRETRGYVQSVLAYNVIYQHQQGQAMQMLSQKERVTRL